MFRQAAKYEPLFENRAPMRLWLFWGNLGLFIFSLIILVFSVHAFNSACFDQKTAWKTLNANSPIIEYINLPRNAQPLSGSLEYNNDIYSQPPSPEVDRAWGILQQANLAWVSSQDLISVGKDLNTSVRLPPTQGFGDDAYPVLLDVGHKIHCLDRIRQDIHFDYYWRSEFPDGNASDLHRAHTTHCIRILLQSILCDASTDFIRYAWFEGYPHPHPDFDINRKCGDIDGIWEWSKQRVVESDNIFYLNKPLDQKTLPMTEDVRRILLQSQG